MTARRVWIISVVLAAAQGLAGGCKPSEPPPPPAPSAPPLGATSSRKIAPPDTGQLPPGHPPLAAPANPPVATGPDGLPPGHPPITAPELGEPLGAEAAEAPTQFIGINLTPPATWRALQPPAPGGASVVAPPVAVFVLPRAEGDEEDATVRLTHYPKMRTVPLQQNLNRWYGQVRQPDGRPTKDVATLESFQTDGATITLVDIPGTVGNKPNYRMLAAVIEHPQGPHFLKVQGPDATVRKWKQTVREYLKSAKTTP